MAERSLAVIGGSGLYELPGIEQLEAVRMSTPFGAPSDDLARGRLGDATVRMLAYNGSTPGRS